MKALKSRLLLDENSIMDPVNLAASTAKSSLQRQNTRLNNDLRTKRNGTPIFVLPPEVLSIIFIFVRNSSIDDYFPAYWICVSHVCHRWREAALSCPSLWSIPVFTRPRLAQEMIHRSKMAPLTIRLFATTWTPKMLPQLKNSLAQISRTRSIELTAQNYTKELKIIYPLFSQPAPLLEYISLSLPASSNQSFPVDTLSDAPSLQRIDFQFVSISWECAIFKHRNLTDLRLKNNNAALNGTSTMAQMMDALHHLPNLRILELHDSVPSHKTSKRNQKTVEFKFLERFELFAKAVDCVFFLRHIRYPSHATTTLCSSSTGIKNSVAILSLLGRHLCDTQSGEAGIPHSPVVIRSAQLKSLNGGVEIAFPHTADDVETRFKFIPGRLESSGPFVRIRLVGGCQPHIRLLTSVSNCFDLSSLRNLLLDWDFADDHTPALRDSFKKFPNIEIINISQSLPEICLALTENLWDEEPKSKQTSLRKGVASQYSFSPIAVLPGLRALIISAYFPSSRHSKDMDCLKELLEERTDYYAPIYELSIEGSIRTWQKRILARSVGSLKVGGDLVRDPWGLHSGESDSEEDEGEIDFSNADEDEDRYS